MTDQQHITIPETGLRINRFGLLPDGREVYSYTLVNKNGMELTVINYGATITSLKIPVAGNNLVDVVLGFDSLDDYIHSFNLPNAPYIGAVVGRYAGRINHGRFMLGNQEIQLTSNHHGHHLHGGFNGFSKAYWQLIGSASDNNPSITLQYISPAGEENFPGELTTQVTYTITTENELQVEFSAVSSEDTIVNLTQHSYFNLDGHTHNTNDQVLIIHASHILETDAANIPTGQYVALNNHPFDFRSAKKCPQQIDNSFVLNDAQTEQATLYSEKNNIRMSVTTNQPAIHVYVGGSCANQIPGKSGVHYHTTSGICFEAQHFPDAPNHTHFPSPLLKKGDQYIHQTTFSFQSLHHA